VGLGQLADEVFDAVIFDLDGTLVDSTPAVGRAWTTWASEYGLPPMNLLEHHGTPSASVVRAIMPENLQEPAMRRITELATAYVIRIGSASAKPISTVTYRFAPR